MGWRPADTGGSDCSGVRLTHEQRNGWIMTEKLQEERDSWPRKEFHLGRESLKSGRYIVSSVLVVLRQLIDHPSIWLSIGYELLFQQDSYCLLCRVYLNIHIILDFGRFSLKKPSSLAAGSSWYVDHFRVD
ncbi:hypothetical protein A2U01_0014786, partial [Trifolium medium]|nr:hypothetical protein [Trifolium medium]